MTRRPAAMAVAAVIHAIAGCTHILTGETPYYEDGPRQAQQSEGDFPAGTKALVLPGRRDDYVRIWSDTGVIAYVWKGSLTPLRDWERQQEEQRRREELEARRRAAEGESPPPASSRPVDETVTSP